MTMMVSIAAAVFNRAGSGHAAVGGNVIVGGNVFLGMQAAIDNVDLTVNRHAVAARPGFLINAAGNFNPALQLD